MSYFDLEMMLIRNDIILNVNKGFIRFYIKILVWKLFHT